MCQFHDIPSRRRAHWMYNATDWISLLLYNQSSNVKVCLWRNVTFPKNGTMQYRRKKGKKLLTTNVAKGVFCDVAVVRVISFSIKISTSFFSCHTKKTSWGQNYSAF